MAIEVKYCTYYCRFEDNAGFGDEWAFEKARQRLSEVCAERSESRVRVIKLGKHEVLYGDCRDGLKLLKACSVHLVVTSPPYNVGIQYTDWNDKMGVNEYVVFARAWLRECYRVLVRGGRICVNVPFYQINGQMNLMAVYYRLMTEVGFTDREVIIWVKKFRDSGRLISRRLFGTCSARNPQLRHSGEAIIIMNKLGSVLDGYGSDLRKWEFVKWSHNIWELEPEGNRTHPAAYPPELVRRLIKLFSFRNQIVIDPFLGSGTTMKVADELGRVCIGCELSGEYIAMAEERLRKENARREVATV